MYYWGKKENKTLDQKIAYELYIQARAKISQFAEIPIEDILDVLDRTGKLWQPTGEFYLQAMKELPQEISFSPEMIKISLDIIPKILNKHTLYARIESEILQPQLLDSKQNSSRFLGELKTYPVGVVSHITAGNVFLGFLDSLIMAIITKNISMVKLSGQNHIFPELFMKSLLKTDKKKILTPYFCLLTWKGGTKEIENIVKEKSHLIMAWGGDEMLKSYKNELPQSTKLVDYGPKVSLQIITKSGFSHYNLDVIGRKIAQDIILWDQSACASPQNLFLEAGLPINKIMEATARALQKTKFKRGNVDADEQVEILKEIHRGKTNIAKKQGEILIGKEYLLHYESKRGLRNSPLHRSLIIKTYKNLNDLREQLIPYEYYLQSASILYDTKEEKKLEILLANIGIKRIAPLGTIMFGTNGAPHDHRFALNELLRFIPWERTHEPIDLAVEAYTKHPFYKNKYKKMPKNFDLIPVLDSKELVNFKPLSNYSGHVFASGGTTGKAKYSYYSTEEFRLATKMLAHNFRLNGLERGNTIANLFVAGNLWSSFLAIEKAMEFCGARQLSISGLADKDLIIQYLVEFRPDYLLGIPTLIIDLADEMKKRKIKLKLKGIFFAGEKFPNFALNDVMQVFQTKKIMSASYATVDAGPIGYQCPHSRPNEHHVFGEYIFLENCKGEAVITTKYRLVQPLVRLKTGDAISPLEESPCPCGSIDPRFILLGRTDDQINIWGSRLKLDEFEMAISSFPSVKQYQIELKEKKSKELLTLKLETNSSINKDKLIQEIYLSLKDFKSTHPQSYLKDVLQVELLKTGELKRVKRTGKLKKIVDLRK